MYQDANPTSEARLCSQVQIAGKEQKRAADVLEESFWADETKIDPNERDEKARV